MISFRKLISVFRYCNFKEDLHDFIIIKYESGQQGIRNVASQFDDIFTLAGVPAHHRAVIRKEMLGKVHCILLNTKLIMRSACSRKNHPFNFRDHSKTSCRDVVVLEQHIASNGHTTVLL